MRVCGARLLWWTGFIFFLMLNAWFLLGCGKSSLRGRLTWTCLRVSTTCIRECVVLFCCHHIISVSTFFIYLHIYIACSFSFMCLWFCLRLGFYVTAVAPVLTDQRTYALRLGGHVLSRHFRYYVPEFSGRIVVQTPLTVR